MKDFTELPDIPFEVKEAAFNAVAGIRPEQSAMLRTLEWKRIQLSDLKDNIREAISAQRAGKPGALAVGAHVCPWEHCCYLYLDAKTLSAEIVWDSRVCSTVGETLSVPHFLEHGQSGQPMELMAMSVAAPDYPIAQGDRVFMELTEALAREEAARMLRDLEQNHPEMFELVTRKHPTREAAIEKGVARMREAGMPCVEPAPAGLIESLAKQRAEHRGAMLAPVSILELSAEDQQKLLALVGERLAPFMRANVGQEGGRWPLRTAAEAADSCMILRFIGPNPDQEDIPAAVWLHCQQQSNAAMQQIPGVIDAERWTVRASGGRRYQLELALWWVGLEFSVFGEPAITIAPLLTQRVLTPDGPEQFSRPAPYAYMWHDATLEHGYSAFQGIRAARDEGHARFKQTIEKVDAQVQAGMPIERVCEMLNLSAVQSQARVSRILRERDGKN